MIATRSPRSMPIDERPPRSLLTMPPNSPYVVQVHRPFALVPKSSRAENSRIEFSNTSTRVVNRGVNVMSAVSGLPRSMARPPARLTREEAAHLETRYRRAPRELSIPDPDVRLPDERARFRPDA